MRFYVADDGYLGPVIAKKAFIALSANIMLTGMPIFQTGGINIAIGFVIEQFEGIGTAEIGV